MADNILKWMSELRVANIFVKILLKGWTNLLNIFLPYPFSVSSVTFNG